MGPRGAQLYLPGTSGQDAATLDRTCFWKRGLVAIGAPKREARRQPVSKTDAAPLARLKPFTS